MKVHVHTVA